MTRCKTCGSRFGLTRWTRLWWVMLSGLALAMNGFLLGMAVTRLIEGETHISAILIAFGALASTAVILRSAARS